ncbi:MAG: alanine racemase, partial [Clostridia bacterium]|nr:alanine racemase [Clostridia bacterium]
AEIFVLGYVDRREFPAAEKFGVTVPVISEAGFDEVMLSDRKLKCYLQVDTGMNRLGVDYRDRKRIRLMTRALTSAKNLRFFGLGTHVFDASDARAVNAQRNRLIRLECDLPLSVCASESLSFGGAGEYKRPGICLYGYGRTAERSRLLPPLSLTTRVVRIQPVEKGETVGYNAVFRAKKHTLVGTLPLGYADGMMRSYVGGSVFLKGEECRVLAVCMDMTMISLPRGAAVGDEVTVFSVERGLEDLTARAGTIVYEGLTALGSRLTRVIK